MLLEKPAQILKLPIFSQSLPRRVKFFHKVFPGDLAADESARRPMTSLQARSPIGRKETAAPIARPEALWGRGLAPHSSTLELACTPLFCTDKTPYSPFFFTLKARGPPFLPFLAPTPPLSSIPGTLWTSLPTIPAWRLHFLDPRSLQTPFLAFPAFPDTEICWKRNCLRQFEALWDTWRISPYSVFQVGLYNQILLHHNHTYSS